MFIDYENVIKTKINCFTQVKVAIYITYRLSYLLFWPFLIFFSTCKADLLLAVATKTEKNFKIEVHLAATTAKMCNDKWVIQVKLVEEELNAKYYIFKKC